MRLITRTTAVVARARARYPFLDHAVRAGARYDQVNGGRLAAAVTYYAFFAAFALGVIGFAILGLLLRGNRTVLDAVGGYLAANLPQLQIGAVERASTVAGVLGLAGLLVAGLSWVDALRTSVRAIWRLNQQPGNFLLRRLIDLGVLIGLGLLLALSIGITFTVRSGVHWLVVDAAGQHQGPLTWLIPAVGVLLSLTVNAVLAGAVLAALPRLAMPLRRLLPAALLVAIGLEVLKTIGRLYIERTTANPAYQVAAGTVGLLLFLNLLSQLTLYAAALTATGHGQVTDLSCRPPAAVEGRPGARVSR